MPPTPSTKVSFDDPPQAGSSRTRQFVVLVMAVIILVPSLFGFGTKFVDFIYLVGGDTEGIFAITPVVNYLLASLGFLCLFIWAALGGMFHDIERPKRTMLENEQRLEARSRTASQPERPTR